MSELFLKEFSSNQKRALAVKFGGEAFLEAIKLYGPSAVLDFLMRITDYVPENIGHPARKFDWWIQEFIAISVTTSTVADFFRRVPGWEVTPEQWTYWNEKGKKVGLL